MHNFYSGDLDNTKYGKRSIKFMKPCKRIDALEQSKILAIRKRASIHITINKAFMYITPHSMGHIQLQF